LNAKEEQLLLVVKNYVGLLAKILLHNKRHNMFKNGVFSG